jgi:hypothetical protein
MKSLARLVLVASVLALPLGGCASISDSLDPTEWFSGELFSSKKKLPGDRKPMFPEGVPGVAQGIPPDLIKGNQQAPAYTADPQTTSTTQQAAVARPEEFKPAPREEPKPKPKAKAKPKTQTAERPPAERAPTAAPVRRAPEPQQQPQAGGGTQWPDPPPPRSNQPSGIQWPDPPPVR